MAASGRLRVVATHLDIFSLQRNKVGEQLCGDTVRVRSAEGRSIVVLSDGLGSGVKANILSTLTAEILTEMLGADASLEEVVSTVLGTLPVCQVRKLAYATFTVLTVEHETGDFRLVNFDNPRVAWLRGGQLQTAPRLMRTVVDREVAVLEGRLTEGDFLLLMSDGVLHAGPGHAMNMAWDWQAVARYLETAAQTCRHSSRALVRRVMQRVDELYQGQFGDDASLLGVSVRPLRQAMVFTGPPLDARDDVRMARRLVGFPGRRIVCGGTTGDIVARLIDEEPQVDLATMAAMVPPIAHLREVDLLTEGILTMSAALELLKPAAQQDTLPTGENGAALLARELLLADEVLFLVGQRINEIYQNPSLPLNVSLRKHLIEQIVALLRQAGKTVAVEYC